jgi:hypothetical protein
VAHEEGNFHSFSAVLGNELCIGTKPGAGAHTASPPRMFNSWSRTQKRYAALHYRHVPSSEENNKVFGQAQSFV